MVANPKPARIDGADNRLTRLLLELLAHGAHEVLEDVDRRLRVGSTDDQRGVGIEDLLVGCSAVIAIAVPQNAADDQSDHHHNGDS